MALFDEDDEINKAMKMKYIEESCNAAKVIIEEAQNDDVLFDLITAWNEPKTVSYEMMVLERRGMLRDEDD